MGTTTSLNPNPNIEIVPFDLLYHLCHYYLYHWVFTLIILYCYYNMYAYRLYLYSNHKRRENSRCQYELLNMTTKCTPTYKLRTDRVTDCNTNYYFKVVNCKGYCSMLNVIKVHTFPVNSVIWYFNWQWF